MLAAILGAGPVADAFFVGVPAAQPFRAIFAEGAFNAAFVPAYAHVHGERGANAAGLFANRIFTLSVSCRNWSCSLSPGCSCRRPSASSHRLRRRRRARRLAIDLTRITFPYLL